MCEVTACAKESFAASQTWCNIWGMSDKAFCAFLTHVPQDGIQLLKLNCSVLLKIPWHTPFGLKLLFQKMPSHIHQLHGDVLDTLDYLKCHFSI